jgi:hypothetical protein
MASVADPVRPKVQEKLRLFYFFGALMDMAYGFRDTHCFSF